LSDLLFTGEFPDQAVQFENESIKELKIYFNEMLITEKSSEEIWPPTEDHSFDLVMENFRESGGCDSKLIAVHKAVLLAVQLRTQYMLRRFSLTELVSRPPESLRLSSDTTIATTSAPPIEFFDAQPEPLFSLTENSSSSPRHIFLRECFRAARIDPSGPIYQLASLWGFLEADVQILQVSAFLDLGLFSQIESMISQIQDKNKLIDIAVSFVRKKIGDVIVTMDQIPEFTSIIVTMDAEGMSWCKSASGLPDANEVIRIANGHRPAIDFDLFAVRHFILRLHALLLLIPSSGGQRDKKWGERKSKTEILLSLCGNLAPAQNPLRITR
jgi:hypothetical protein